MFGIAFADLTYLIFYGRHLLYIFQNKPPNILSVCLSSFQLVFGQFYEKTLLSTLGKKWAILIKKFSKL